MSTLALAHSPSFYERIVLDMLSKMNLGRLDVSLPNGQTITLGNGEGNVKADMSVNDNDFFRRCVLYGDVGFGESYMDGIWETSSITNVIKWFLLNIDNAPNLSGSEAKTAILGILNCFNKIYH